MDDFPSSAGSRLKIVNRKTTAPNGAIHMYLVLLRAIELWDISQERGEGVIDPHGKVVQVDQQDNQDLIAAHSVDGRRYPFLHRVRPHFDPPLMPYFTSLLL